MDIVSLILLGVVAVAGVLLAVFQLPGTWLILAAAAGYDWYHDWQRIGWPWLVGLLAVAVAAEIADTASSMLAARKAGASRRASFGALIGGFAGMIFLTAALPIPVVGTIAGGMLGCFLGALIAEMTVRDDLAAGARVGVFATLGRLVGMLVKTGSAFAIAGAALGLAIW